MKTFTTSAIISFLAATAAIAAPVEVARDEPAAVIAFSNDMSGAYARVTIPFGKTVHLIPDLFKGTSIDVFHDGSSFLATSAMLVGGLQYPLICAVQSNDGGLQAQRIEGQLTPQKTYLKFGEKTPEGLNRVEVTELRGAFIQCNVFNN